MQCHELAQRIQAREPDARPYDVARLCVLMTNYIEDVGALTDEGFEAAWSEMGLRLQAVTDQHEAIAEELRAMADKPPQDIDMSDIWTLMRIIKVQGQVLRMYTAPPEWTRQS